MKTGSALRLAAVMIVCGLVMGAAGAQEATAPVALPPLTDINGSACLSSFSPGLRAMAFIFVSAQCPLANLYSPRIHALAREYSSRGVGMFVVDSNAEDSVASLRAYARERNLGCPVIHDDGTRLADLLAASRTPEAIVLDDKHMVRYRGRIDDNADPAQVAHSDLKEALDAVLAGKPVTHARTFSIGCMIFRGKAAATPVSAGAVTYSHDVAKILDEKCVTCHRPGEAAPFSLTSYAQARTWAQAMKDYTRRRVMPPWQARPGFGDFDGARALTAHQIAVLARWADTGAPIGDGSHIPPLPRYESPAGWQLGTPDLVSGPDRPYHLAADGKDVYRNYVLPINYDHDQFIRAVEFHPSNRAIVHHMIVFFDLSGQSVDLTAATKDGEPGYTVPGTTIGVPWEQTRWVVGWAPGNTARFLPAGTAFRLPKGAKVVLQVHYHKDGKPETDQSRVALYLGDTAAVDKELVTHAVDYPFLSIPPGDPHYTVHSHLTTDRDVHVWAVMPHMHMLGREMKLTATLPDGSVKPLIAIDDWNFNWQETYRFREPVALPKGTRIDLVASYDNTENNPRQPSHPPRHVGFGEQTTDEMCLGFFQFTDDGEHLLAHASAGTK